MGADRARLSGRWALTGQGYPGRGHAAAAAIGALPVVLMGVDRTAVACRAVACNVDCNRDLSSRNGAALASLDQI